MTKDHKKDVNATLDFLDAVIKGHWLACACELLGVNSLDAPIDIPPGTSPDVQRSFIEGLAEKVVNRVTVVDSAFLSTDTPDTPDKVHNYARVLCHYGSLCMEFRDAWSEGDGERVMRCWKLFLPHFKESGRTKYSLEALRLQFQVNVILSPNLAHQIKWHRFVNTKGGLGKNIPCDLYNEHMNKLIKIIIRNMGSNLTERALQCAVRSVATLDMMCHKFDRESDVPHGTSAHSTRPDIDDIKQVVSVVLTEKVLTKIDGREHKSFPKIHTNPLHKWDLKKTILWIETKKKAYMKYGNKFRNDECAEEAGEVGVEEH